MSDLLQCYAIDAEVAVSSTVSNTHSQVKKVAQFISGPQISYRSPLGEWVTSTLLGDLMAAAAEAMDRKDRFVLLISHERLPVLLGQLEALEHDEAAMDSDPEFIMEMTETVQTVIQTGKSLWIGV